MPSEARIWVVIAAFNEAAVIGRVVAEATRRGYVTVVVDDGSRDATGEMAGKAGAIVLRHPVNLGQGAALQTGIDYALRHDPDFVVTFDAGGRHRAQDIGALIAALENHDADFALGSRFLGSATNLPLEPGSCSRPRSPSPASRPGYGSPTRITACAP